MSHQLLLKLGIVAWYEYNKTYIAENLCENREKPALKCCGKCYLNKQLAKAGGEKAPIKPLDLKLSKLKISAFLLPPGISYSTALAVVDRQHYERPVPLAADVCFSVEHPPG